MSEKPTILIVDDTPINIEILARILREEYHIIFATSAAAALKLVEKHIPDLILLDVVMPEMDGFELCRRLKKISELKDVPVLFVTSLNEPNEEMRGFDAGGDDYIIKPANPAILLSRVRIHLDRRKQTKKQFNVLVVDDVPANIDVAAAALKHDGRKIFVATNGADALKQLKSRDFDLVLLDVEMPGMNGFEVCRNIKNDPRISDIPVIMLTANNDEQSLLSAFESGAQDYVLKPFNKNELLARVRTHLELRQKNRMINLEREKSERLLMNILPYKVVQDLREQGHSSVQAFDNVTILFTDIVSFAEQSSTLAPRVLINELNEIFTAFDEIIEHWGCERIKTVGDAYLAVCGLPVLRDDHAIRMVNAAFDMREKLKERNANAKNDAARHVWNMRFGIHSGSVVGGVVGIKKYIYDIFGDAVNTASRMESACEPMQINISADTCQLVENSFSFQPREPMNVKGKGMMKMFYIKERKK